MGGFIFVKHRGVQSMLVADIGYRNLVARCRFKIRTLILSGIFSPYSSLEYYLFLGCILINQEDLSNFV
jgi:hypothetical protein